MRVDVPDQDIETSVIVHDEVVDEDDSSRKRRHESGESVESGYFETDGTNSNVKQKKVDETGVVTLVTLNEKMDQILENMKDKK